MEHEWQLTAQLISWVKSWGSRTSLCCISFIAKSQISIDPRVWTQLINVADNSAILQLKGGKILFFYSITAWFCIFFQIFYVLSMNMKKLICAKGKSKLFSTATYENIRKTWNTDFIVVCQIWQVCISEVKVNFLLLWPLYGLIFDLKTLGSLLDHDLMVIFWEKSHFNFGGKFEFRW